MKKILNSLRKKERFYNNLKKVYGATIGFYWFKERYLKNLGLYNGERRIKLLDNKRANKIIINSINSKKPFMLARYGSTEFRNLTNNHDFDLLCFYSGFFPNNKELLRKFRKIYNKGSKQIDYLCVWNYKKHFFKKISWIKNFPNLRGLFDIKITSPNQPWIKELKGKKVLVIHPFKKTIESQYKRMEKLKILPKLKKLEVIKAVQTIAGNKDKRFKDWFGALDYMKKQIDKKDFDIALIGCGAYGLPLAAHIKSKGKQVIHMGGGLQLFFGIKGKRWETLSKIKFNEHWVYPLKEDFPKNYEKIEGGCYW